MVFSSLPFLFYFLPIVLIAYFCVPRQLKNAILFISSLIFYAWGEPIYVVLMLFSTVVDYTHGMLVEKHRGTKKAKYALISSMVINLALLCFFKYSDFIIANINALTGSNIPLLNLPLPIGISFYTFQTMSYTIDVYRKDAKVQRNIISFGAYVALFPQLIAGPIVRYQTIADQLDTRKESFDMFSTGIKRFVTGVGKKVLLANSIGIVWTTVSGFESSQMSVLSAWIAIIAFSFQIYFDFSGYSDMAIGLGQMFGFQFLENFNYPYISKSITEFWRRWHISLGTWFKEYVYIPLGGNRCSIGRQLMNIGVVWLLTGIWHGASWNFIAWGVYYCVLLLCEKLFLLKLLKKAPTFVSHIYTLFAVIIGWVFFAFDSLADGFKFIGYMFGNGIPLVDNQSLYYLLTNALLLAILVLASTPLPSKLANKIMIKLQSKPVATIVIQNLFIVVIFVVSVAYLVDSSYNPFLYFRF